MTLALIPIIGLLALGAVALVFTHLRQTWLATAKAEQDEFVQTVLRDDAEAQATLFTDLLEGKRPMGEALESFLHRRAALVPGIQLDEPASWDPEALGRHAKDRYEAHASEANRVSGLGLLAAGLLIVGISVVTGMVVYGFSTSRPTPAYSLPAPPPLVDPAAPPAVDPSGNGLPDAAVPSPSPLDSADSKGP